MRTATVIALILLAVIVTGGVLLTATAADAAGACEAAANEIAVLADMGEWERAKDALSGYAAAWKKSRNLLDLLLPKEMLDSVTEAYGKLGTAIDFRDRQQCAEACASLARHADDVRGNERITLENLL